MTQEAAVFAPEFLQQATGASLQGRPTANSVVIDSRDALDQALFVALRGPTHDGHDFVKAVLGSTAGGAMVNADWAVHNDTAALPLVVVEDTYRGLADLGQAHRNRSSLQVAAVTGSNGKTTTKELLAAALSPLGPVHKTPGNKNNHIGVPLSLLGIRDRHAAAVFELGMNHPGEIRTLSSWVRPHIGIITNVARSHLAGVASREGVARAKAELAGSIQKGGVLIIPFGDEDLNSALAEWGGRSATVGFDPAADVHIDPLPAQELGARFRITPHKRLKLKPVEIQLQSPGRHMMANGAAAWLAAVSMGVSETEAVESMAQVPAVGGRLTLISAGGVSILDDTYNANPASLRAALDVLAGHREGRRFALLGDMFELGDEAEALHAEAGSGAAFLDGLATVGELSRALSEGSGLPAPKRLHTEDFAEACAWLANQLVPGDTVLVKGSRGMALERAVRWLAEHLQAEAS